MTVDVEDLVTVGEAAMAVGVRERRLRRWIAAGRMSVVRGPRGQMVDPAEVREIAATVTDGQGTVDRQEVTVRRSGGDGRVTVAPAVDVTPLVALIEKQEQTIMELSGRLGFFQAKNAELEERVKLLTAGAAGEADQKAPDARRGRWFWLRRGAKAVLLD